MNSYLAPTAASLGNDLRVICDRLRRDGWRAVQLSAAMPGARPRELGASARRDLAATLRRTELVAAGMDLWIPQEHFLDPSTVDRAVSSFDAACGLASDLGITALSVILPGPDQLDDEIREVIESSSVKHGVLIADHRMPYEHVDEIESAGLDPAACFSVDRDPVNVVLELAGRLVAPRLSDLIATGLRGVPGDVGGRLDIHAYRAAVATVASNRHVALDLRQLTSPWEGMRTARAAWLAAGPGED
ncbi:MAG: hypothetical protein CMJ40_00925 [Phycisphaerae bacterium]|nr:hypothetical protein [Phycisphaerae bacterium]